MLGFKNAPCKAPPWWCGRPCAARDEAARHAPKRRRGSLKERRLFRPLPPLEDKLMKTGNCFRLKPNAGPGPQSCRRGGEGKFEGEGGFSGTLPPLQGKFGSAQPHQKQEGYRPPNSSFRHIWAKKALQTRILSTCTSSSAKPEAFQTLGPIKRGFRHTRSRVYLGATGAGKWRWF